MSNLARPTLDDIRRAAEAIKGHVVRTPFVSSPRLAQQLGLASLRLKLENQQFTGSFKDRGAYYKLKSLSPDEAKRGVIAMSAGNHAQGVAYHAQRLGIPATIVMPEQTPFTKIERTASFGPRVILKGDSIDAAAVYARELAAKENLIFVHPYDDPFIVAGQGTIGLEIVEDDADLDFLVIPIGGGGLIGGISTAVKALKPSIEIYGVESDLYPSMHHALNEIPPANGGQTLADGIAVKSPGALTRAIVEEHVREVLLVDEMSVERAVGTLIETQRIVAEGAGAAALAAIMCHPSAFRNCKVGIVVGGGNIDSRLLSQVLMRTLVLDGRMATLRIEIIDQPGVMSTLTRVIGQAGGNIMDITHHRLFIDLPVKRAEVDVLLETRNAGHVDEIIKLLEQSGFSTRRLSSRSSQE
ncbi:MAG TPA: threonine ammonia-lyase [Dongiaceae bacterium]|nr:threonine ammonia-lyase [Dongiaceae bacterium]